MTEMEGQMSIWDIGAETRETRKPCEYSFQRYLGQTVRCSWNGYIGKIVGIDRYYTEIRTDDGDTYALTPTNTVPFEFIRSEWHPITDQKVEWDKRRNYIPIVHLIESSRPPEKIDLVIDGTVNKAPSLIGFKAWVSGFEGKFIEYEPVLWKEKSHDTL